MERSIQQLSESIIQLQVLWETNVCSLGEAAFQIVGKDSMDFISEQSKIKGISSVL